MTEPTYRIGWHTWTVPLSEDPHSTRRVTVHLPLDLEREEADRLVAFLESFHLRE